MASEKVLQRVERWLAKADSHPWGRGEADGTVWLGKNGEAWEKYGQFYEGGTLEGVAELLEAVRAAS